MNWSFLFSTVLDLLLLIIFLYSILLLSSYVFLGLYSIGETKKYLHRNRFTDYRLLASSVHAPTVSIIAPAYNEAKTIVENVRSLLSIFYTNLEVIIVNDGSKDNSLELLIKAFDLEKMDFFIDEKIATKKVKGVYKSRNSIHHKLIVVDKENGGKADALNVGINISSKNYLVCIDVDCILEQDALLKMVKPFMEQTSKKIIATGGVIRVANSCVVENGRLLKVRLAEDYLARMQILEYIRAFILGRMAWSRLNGLMLISGAFGAFDKEIAIACGGYNHNTVGEDMELVVRMRRYMEEKKEDYIVRYIPDPLCWTEVPANHTILGRQRNRWIRGTFETLKFHRIMFFNPNYRVLGMISYPYWFLFEMCAPIFEFLGFIAFVIMALTGYLDWEFFFTFFLFIIIFGYLYSAFAILMEVVSFNQYKRRIDIFRLMLTGLTEPFFFHPFVVWSGIKGYWDLIKKNKSWGEMTRQGFQKKLVTQTATSANKTQITGQNVTRTAADVQEENIWFFEKSIAPFFNRILHFISNNYQSFIPYIYIYGLIILGNRIFEICYACYKYGIPESTSIVFLASLIKDLGYWISSSAVHFPLFLLFSLFHRQLGKIFFILCSSVLLLIQLALSQYYITSLVPLGADLWGYSWADIQQTVGSSGGVPISLIIASSFIVTCNILLNTVVVKKIRFGLFSRLLILFLWAVSLLTNSNSIIEEWMPAKEAGNNLSINKSYFFIKSTWNHFFLQKETIDIYANNYLGLEINQTEGTKLTKLQYLDESNYPFLHKVDSSKDVLSNFFQPSNKKPNIVILMVEGLGRAFTNSGAYLGNFTPRLDSISQKSLYWENFLSEGGRTFAVLPSLVSSLPFAKNGFNELGDAMPNHFSLINLLQQNGYETNFYYGGDASFDNMRKFLLKNKIDHIYDETNFPSGYAKMPTNNGFSWGYGDKELFNSYLNSRQDSIRSYLNLVLTVSTHSPFLINEQDKYLQSFENRMSELGITENQKKEYRNFKYQYASIMYMDDAIGSFIESYKKRPDFNNTVFLITGDHRMPEIPMSSKLDRYHVPLIIYSPLLKRTAKFASISTHFDIAPSILAWLQKQYKLELPDTVAWMGSGLDTARNFRNIHSYPFIQTKTDIIDYVEGGFWLNQNTLFEINSNMNLTPILNESKSNQLKAGFNRFKTKNNQFAEKLQLIPDSLLKRYSKN
jgi:cellulose synthase/poly-beta-1,6-N-acetylglucosamine synthase-like glycosyltransferase/phosphoglycerol transferase MdoB-like AlkP superfamily enzyme